MTPREIGIATAASALIVDQGSKAVLLYGLGFAHVAPGRRILASPFLDLVVAWNSGVSYSLFQAHSTLGVVVLSAIAVVAICLLAWWLWRTTRRAHAVGLGLVIGGALGNLIDRLVYGQVADFFDLHFFGRSLFVCNLADVAITLGAIAILYDALETHSSAAKERSSEASP